jgi:hypothetical protein
MEHKYFILGCLIVLFVSCKENPSEPVQLAPYERWQSFRLHNYTIDQIRSCFCPGAGGTARITVRSDTIATVMKLLDSTYVTFPIPQYYLTVDSLFSIIHNRSGDSIVVTYNITYGYPEKLDINPQWHPMDGGVLYETSNLQIP